MGKSARARHETVGFARLADIAAAEQACTRCPLYRDATQAVPGEGQRNSRIMVVGEQPGDKEDLQGHPFVGPAGALLDRALTDAGIDRRTVFVTNAVKHFKHEPRGKRRLHKRPNAYEIDRCKWWLDLERTLVQPELIVAMGATAVRGILGRAATIASLRHTVQTLDDGARLAVTVHPSSILRMREHEDRAAAYDAFVADLARCAKILDGG